MAEISLIVTLNNQFNSNYMARQIVAILRRHNSVKKPHVMNLTKGQLNDEGRRQMVKELGRFIIQTCPTYDN